MTLRCIAGIETPDDGKIVVDGQVLFDHSKKINLPPQQRSVGFLFQNYALFPTMTVRQNLLSSARRTHNQKAVNSLIKQFDLQDLEQRLPSQLSGGQQQRVALARILASQPRILLLDEPFSALDSFLRWQITQQMAHVIENFAGTSILVSHDREEIYRLCDEVTVVAHGYAHGMKKKDDVFQHPYTVQEARLAGFENIAMVETRHDGMAWIPAWGVALPKLANSVCALAVSAYTLDTEAGEIKICATVLHILPGIHDCIVIVQPEQGNGTLQWKTKQTHLSTGMRIELSIAWNDMKPLFSF